MKISRELSSYLDLLRFVAALAVMLGHMDQDGIPMNWIPIAKFSHESVIIFFVLSGFIIYNNTKSKNINSKEYSIARTSRIYSVALPAIFFSFLVSWAVELWASQPFPRSHLFFSFNDFFGSLFFLNQSWDNQTKLTLNNPYWSLCYEVWFYAIFGVFVFMRGQTRWFFLTIVALFAGPAILVLFPLWIMGAWAASHVHNEVRWVGWLPWVAFLFAPFLILVVNMNGIDVSVREELKHLVPGFWRLRESQRFISDYAIGIALVVHLLAFSSLPKGFHSFLNMWKKTFANWASFSFTLYLFHRPMTKFIGHYFSDYFQSAWHAALAAIMVFFSCWAISLFTEKQLPAWRQGLHAAFKIFENQFIHRHKNIEK